MEEHVKDYIFLRILRNTAGVGTDNMLKLYLAIIRPILEYALPVWKAIPEYLSYKIESVQRRALKIINPREEIMTNFQNCSTWRK